MQLTLDKPIALGRTAEIYAWQERFVLKLYHDWCPPHWVEIRKPFWIARTELTNAQYERFDPEHKRTAWSPDNDCPVLYCDRIAQVVSWKGGTDVSKLAGRLVRLRFVLQDADVYSMRFR